MARSSPLDRLAAALQCDRAELTALPGPVLSRLLTAMLAPSTAIELPPLEADNVDTYIAAVAVALASGQLSGPSARTMLYAAQLVITSRDTRPRRPPQ
jgi:hypothetical protein